MATDCNQEAVLYFMRERGGRVKNEDLMDHFRAAIPTEPALKTASKEALKRYVDNVAFVKLENGEKYVCLKKKFKTTKSSNAKSDINVPDKELKACEGKNITKAGGQMFSIEFSDRDPEGALPASGDTTDNAGGAKSQPDITVKFSEGVNSKTNSEICRINMGNSNSSIITGRKSEQSWKINQPQGSDEGPRAEISDACSQNPTRIAETAKENISQCERRGTSEVLVNSPRDDCRSLSFSNTPKNNRNDCVEVLMTSSPQIRRSAVRRNSVYLLGRYRDCPRGDIESHPDYEPAAVTLEPLEHEWMMCASDGQWDSLYRLLVSDPTLLTRKDFVTGFTCLHWAAKLGNHELIAMLVNFAKEHKLSLNINARSSAGYTPLHLAAMHNHMEVVKLLVGAFDADVEARDYNGKKACHYLKSDIAQNILDIVGACVETDAESADIGDANRWRLSRVIQANFRPQKPQNQTNSEEDASESVLIQQKSLRRKSSFTKMKPSLHKIRLRSQIVHSASLFDRFEEEAREETPNPLRPKSNLFG